MSKILIIDDDPTIRRLLHIMLHQEGYEVMTSSDGEAGLQLARTANPDIIICDINMPRLNGYEVLTQLRQDSTTAEIPFIFLSAEVGKICFQQETKFSADMCLSKPFTRCAVLNAITAQLMQSSKY